VIQDVRERGLQDKAPEIVLLATDDGVTCLGAKTADTVRTETFVARSERAGTEGFLNEGPASRCGRLNSKLAAGVGGERCRKVYDKSVLANFLHASHARDCGGQWR